MGFQHVFTGQKGRDDFEAACAAGARAVYAGRDVILCHVAGRFPLYVPAADAGIAPWLALRGCWEAWVTVALLGMARPGMRALDVGANVGYYTVLLAAAVGEKGRVVAVEPNPELHRLLERNAEANGFHGRVTCLKVAAGKSHGRATLRWPPRLPGSGSIAVAPPRDSLNHLDVPVAPLRDLVQDTFHLLKIDAEGSDYDVLRGAEDGDVLEKDALVVLEHRSTFYAEPEEELNSVLERGWRLHFIDYDGETKPTSVGKVCAEPERTWNLVLAR